MAWLVLVLSGVLEAVWATALGASNGFKRKLPTFIFIASMAISMAGLAYAMTELPTGTSYAVWVGVGAVLTAALAVIRRKEKLAPGRAALLAALVGCVVGLKVVS